MIFKVPDDIKGSFVLSSLKKTLWAKMQVSIDGNDLYNSDVKMAVKKGILVPFIEGEYDGLEDVSSEVVIINRSNRNLVLDDIVLKPGKSAIVSRTKSESSTMQGAESDGLIDIISESPVLDKNIKKDKIKSKKINVEYVEPIENHIEEPKTVAKVWDFQEKATKEAEMVNKVSDIVEIETDNSDENDVDMIDKSNKKSSIKKKTKIKDKNKIAKKKGKSSKNKKVKEIKPVGEVKELPDVVIPLDSRGNIIEDKPSKVLESLIDDFIPDEIPFADKEQEIEKKKSREMSEDWDWGDL